MRAKTINTLDIRAFRGLRELTLHEAGQFNLLVGANNSGKTSVLEAIFALCNPLDIREWVNLSCNRDSYLNNTEMLNSLCWLFPYEKQNANDKGEVRCISIACSGECPVTQVDADIEDIVRHITRKVSTSLELQLPIDNDLIKEENGVRIILSVKSAERGLFGEEQAKTQMTLWETSKRTRPASVGNKWKTPAVLILPHEHRQARRMTRRFSDSVLGGMRKDLVDIVRMFDRNILDISVLDADRGVTLAIEHASMGVTPLSIWGDGLRRVLFMAVELMFARGGVLLIDELETAIHSSAFSTVFSWLMNACRRLDIQVFATTHSLECIDAIIAAADEYREDVVAYRLEQEGRAVKRFAGETLYAARYELGLEIR